MIIVVGGPTGVGKSTLAETLAKKYDAVVINADAMQVYRGLNIGTAKIKPQEIKAKEHFLFDIKNVDEEYHVFAYQYDLRKLLDQYAKKNVIIVGGTGLYIRAGLYDYRFDEEPPKVLKLLYPTIFIGLTTDRATLYEKINQRVDQMIDEGLIEEVKDFYQQGIKTKPLIKGIGYKEIYQYLDGDITLEQAIDLIKKNSRHYAKRQYTWFNNQLPMKWFTTDYNDFTITEKSVIEYINQKNSSH